VICSPAVASSTDDPDNLNKIYSPWIEGDTLYIKGTIDSHIYDYLAMQAADVAKIRVIDLNSFGGNLEWAMNIAKKIISLDKDTRLDTPYGRRCGGRVLKKRSRSDGVSAEDGGDDGIQVGHGLEHLRQVRAYRGARIVVVACALATMTSSLQVNNFPSRQCLEAPSRPCSELLTSAVGDESGHPHPGQIGHKRIRGQRGD
jgi:hypothetical protein